MNSTIKDNLLLQFAELAALIAVSLAIGLGINHFRAEPLALSYRTPDQRLSSQLAELVKRPPFEVSDSQTIGLPEFRSIVADHGALIVDARPLPFYQEGHVPRAINLSREDFARDYQRLSAVLNAERDRSIVVYCSGHACHDSKMVAGALLSLGFSKVRVFTGGWKEWKNAGLAVNR